jgi:hypothetical protein
VGTGEGGGGGLRPCGIGGEPAGEGEDWGFFSFAAGGERVRVFFPKQGVRLGSWVFLCVGPTAQVLILWEKI